MSIVSIVLLVIAIVLTLRIIYASAFTVEQNNVRLTERFGKYLSSHTAGLHFKIPLIDSVTVPIFLGLEELELTLETKTKDNVFTKLKVSIQKRIRADQVTKMYYELSDPKKQMESFVLNVIRAEVPKMDLNELFEKKDEIADLIKQALESQMEKYGFEIESTQIKDIDPDAKVKEAMNSVQASQRNREAAANNAEAGKITLVKAAEARKDADILHGQGIAGERAEIAKGFAQAIKTLKDADPTVTEEEINKFLLSAQYLDTMKDIGANGKNSVVFLPNSPAGMHEIMGSLMGSKIVSNGQESSEKKY